MDCYEKLSVSVPPINIFGGIYLTFEERSRSRGRAHAGCGEEICWFLKRGEFLNNGDFLKSEEGVFISVHSAVETLCRVTGQKSIDLLRAAYHLGNRHVLVSVTPEALFFQADHILEEMVRGLGLSVERVKLAFDPERGAYSGDGDHHH